MRVNGEFPKNFNPSPKNLIAHSPSGSATHISHAGMRRDHKNFSALTKFLSQASVPSEGYNKKYYCKEIKK